MLRAGDSSGASLPTSFRLPAFVASDLGTAHGKRDPALLLYSTVPPVGYTVYAWRRSKLWLHTAGLLDWEGARAHALGECGANAPPPRQ